MYSVATHLLLILFPLLFFLLQSRLLLSSAFLLFNTFALFLLFNSRLFLKPSLLFHHCLQGTNTSTTFLLRRWRRGLIILLRFLLFLLLFRVSLTRTRLAIGAFIFILSRSSSRGFDKGFCRGLRS